MNFLQNTLRYLKDNFLAEQNRWLAWVPFLFGLGIAVYLRLPFEPNYWWSLGVLEATLLLYYLLRHKNLHLLFLGILLIEFGFINIQMQTLSKSRKVRFTPEITQYMRGRITEISFNRDGRMRLLLDNVADFDKPLSGRYRLTLMGDYAEKLKIGQCVELVGTVFPPSPFPVVDGFQLNRKYFYDEISGIGYANSEVFQIDCARNEAPTFKVHLNKLRKEITDDIARLMPKDEAGVADAILIGDQSHIPQQIIDNYRNSGLAHFLSVSGLHLGTIAGLVFFVLRFLAALVPWFALRFEAKKLAACGAILFSVMYLLISGMAVPAERAFIMTTVVLLGVIFNRQAISIRMVCFAGFVLLLISPQALASVSFQMSFAAVVALIAFYEKFSGTMAKWNTNSGFVRKIFFYLAGIVICDFVASMATMPFAIYHFHRVSIYTSLTNLLAGPLIGLYLMPLVLLCLASLPFGLAVYPLKALACGIGWLNKITGFVSALPQSVVYIDALPFWGFALIVCGAYWLCVWQRRWRLWGLLPVIIGLIPLFFAGVPDVVFAPNGAGIAVKNQKGELVLLPQKTDKWTASVWRDNFKMPVLNKEQKEKLKDVFEGKTTDTSEINLSCDSEGCFYRKDIYFNKAGILKIKEKEVDTKTGGYIFIKDKIKVVPMVSNNLCRPWHFCRKE